MSNIWFTADTHLGHANIIKYTKRPFANIEQMDATLISNWNSKIAPDDQVYFLGDFCFANTDKAKSYLNRLNGHIAFIEGNHDRSVQPLKHLFKPYTKYMEINIDGISVTLCHYALRVWNKAHHGSYSLYGHSHGSLPDDPNARSFDCGVDTNNFFPYSWEDVKRKMGSKTWKAIDHHGA